MTEMRQSELHGDMQSGYTSYRIPPSTALVERNR